MKNLFDMYRNIPYPFNFNQIRAEKSIKLGNLWVFVQLIFARHWPMNQPKKNQTLPNLRLLISADSNPQFSTNEKGRKNRPCR